MITRLPEGYYSRPVVMEDADQIAGLYNAQSRWLIGGDQITKTELISDWGSAFFHPETDSRAVFTADHQAVGFVEMWDMRAPHVQLMAFTVVHPDHMRRGIGSFLAEWVEGRARNNLGKAPAGARVVLYQYLQSNHQEAIDLVSRRGYSHIRDSYRMRIDFDCPPAAPVIPEGIVIRSLCNEEEERLALFTRHESFLDHWGAVDEPFEDYYKRWKYTLDHDPNHDLSLWFLAWDGEQPAGVSICYKQTEEDPGKGFVQTIGVRRPWRRRGLGLALLQHSFCELYRRGKPRVGLGVDASSLTGATRLYERAGMYIERTSYTFELELRDGITLTRQ